MSDVSRSNPKGFSPPRSVEFRNLASTADTGNSTEPSADGSENCRADHAEAATSAESPPLANHEHLSIAAPQELPSELSGAEHEETPSPKFEEACRIEGEFVDAEYNSADDTDESELDDDLVEELDDDLVEELDEELDLQIGCDDGVQAKLIEAEEYEQAEVEPEDDSRESTGIEFLEQIERKHNQVLTELDDLNARIERVLDSYLQSRKPSSDTNNSEQPSNNSEQPSNNSEQPSEKAA